MLLVDWEELLCCCLIKASLNKLAVCLASGNAKDKQRKRGKINSIFLLLLLLFSSVVRTHHHTSWRSSSPHPPLLRTPAALLFAPRHHHRVVVVPARARWLCAAAVRAGAAGAGGVCVPLPARRPGAWRAVTSAFLR